MSKVSRYYTLKPEPEIVRDLKLIAPCPACKGFPVAIINKPLRTKFNWEIKTIIECRNEDCEVKPKVTGCVIRRNTDLAHQREVTREATRMAYNQWPPVINMRLLKHGK